METNQTNEEKYVIYVQSSYDPDKVGFVQCRSDIVSLFHYTKTLTKAWKMRKRDVDVCVKTLADDQNLSYRIFQW